MSEDLSNRLVALRDQIATADPEARAALLEHLEQAVLGLEAQGGHVPAWARELLEAAHEADVEDGFDNMPV